MALSIGTNLLNAVIKEGQVAVLRNGSACDYTLSIQDKNQRSQITSIEVVQQDTTTCLALTSENDLYLLNLLTGNSSRLYQFEAGLKVNSMTTSPSGSTYVVVEKTNEGPASAVLKQLVLDPLDGQIKLEENAFTKQYASFSCEPVTKQSGQISGENPHTYQTTQFHLGYDGSPYLVAREITASAQQPNASLFLASPSGNTGKQEGLSGSLNFQRISGADQAVQEVVAVNATTAMVKVTDKAGQPRWLSYSSASGIPNPADGLLLPLDTTSLFWWNKPTSLVEAKAAVTVPINRVNAVGADELLTLNASPDLTLNLYGQPDAGKDPFQSFASYNIPALLPVQPSAQRFETSGESIITPLNAVGNDFILSTTDEKSGVIDHVLVVGVDTPNQSFSTSVPINKIGNMRIFSQPNRLTGDQEITIVTFHLDDQTTQGSRYTYAGTAQLGDLIASVSRYRVNAQTRAVESKGNQLVALQERNDTQQGVGANATRRWSIQELEKLLNEAELSLQPKADGTSALELDNQLRQIHLVADLEQEDRAGFLDSFNVYSTRGPGVTSISSYEVASNLGGTKNEFGFFDAGFTAGFRETLGNPADSRENGLVNTGQD